MRTLTTLLTLSSLATFGSAQAGGPAITAPSPTGTGPLTGQQNTASAPAAGVSTFEGVVSALDGSMSQSLGSASGSGNAIVATSPTSAPGTDVILTGTRTRSPNSGSASSAASLVLDTTASQPMSSAGSATTAAASTAAQTTSAASTAAAGNVGPTNRPNWQSWVAVMVGGVAVAAGLM